MDDFHINLTIVHYEIVTIKTNNIKSALICLPNELRD